MKFTKNWLFDYLETSYSFNEILDGLLNLGIEVEKIIDYTEKLKDFKVAKILEAKKHPGADKLQICKVNTAFGIKEIVCGASNARAGINVIFANTGTIIPGSGITLKEAEIRGIKSSGMMLSEMELGISDEHGAIIEVSNNFKVGDLASTALDLNDTLVEVAITPNLGHLLSVRNIAKALASVNLGVFKEEKPNHLLNNIYLSDNYSKTNVWYNYSIDNNFNIIKRIEGSKDITNNLLELNVNNKISPAFLIVNITNIDSNQETPSYIKSRLKIIGQKIISPIVDITNYLTIDLNHPMHAYDKDTIGNNITVDFGSKEDNILALDNNNYNNLKNVSLIKSNNKTIAIAGVIGGKDFSVTDKTKNVTLECASFIATEITKSSKKLNISTASSYHFQRGTNPLDLMYAANKAVNLIKEICDCTIEGIFLAQNISSKTKTIETSISYINNLLGTSIPKDNIRKYLESQDFIVKIIEEKILIEIPCYRNDVEQECDIADIILKIYGIKNIVSKELPKTSRLSLEDIPIKVKEVNNYFNLNLIIKKSLATLGLLENINMSFISEENATLFNVYSEELKLSNPISTELSVMRKSLIPSLVASVRNNTRSGYSNLSFFEVANIYNSLEDSAPSCAAILSGSKYRKDWLNKTVTYNSFDIKEILFDLLTSLGINTDKFKISKQDLPKYFHPSRSGSLLLGNTVIAYFGELTPKLTEYFNLKSNPAIFELFVNTLILPKQKLPLTIKTASNLMPLERDFAFILDNKITAIEIIRLVSSVNRQLINSVKIFDVFTHKDNSNRKSIGFSVFLTPTTTLTEADINNLSDKIIHTVTTKLGGILRDKHIDI